MQANRTGTLTAVICGLAIGFAILTPGAASAQYDESKYNNISTPAARNACRPDVFRLCAGEIPNVAQITACLRRKKASLSDACRTAMGDLAN